MREDFLHYVWKYKKFAFAKAKTTINQSITLLYSGQHNLESGPDFFNARLRIANQEWAGNVEIHLKSSDWYAHHHETDRAYDNVILHVVWEHDVDVFRADNSSIPTLELKHYVSQNQLANYHHLFSHKSDKWILCEKDIGDVPEPTWNHWQERLYLERLERKTNGISELLIKSNNNWEQALFIMLARNFGTKINGDAFGSLGETVDFDVILKCTQDPYRLEALLLGMSGLIPDESFDSYAMQLQGEYEFVKHKYQLKTEGVLPVKFFKLRPANFPTIRLSQLAQLYFKTTSLFQKCMHFTKLEEFYDLFEVQASTYWDTHFNFGKSQSKRAKKLSKSFIDLVLINTIIPIKFAYNTYIGKEDHEAILELIDQIKPEKNSIIERFNGLKPKATSALHSQGLIQLKNEYCDKQKCLHCAVGNWVLGKN